MTLSRKIAYNTLSQIVGRAATTILALITVGVLMRYLGVVGFGAYATTFAFTGLFSTLADFGFMLLLMRELGRGRIDKQKATSNILTIRTIFAIIVYGIAFGACWFFKYPEVVKWGIGIVAVAQLWGTIQGTVIAVLQANLRVDKAVIGDVVSRVIILTLVLWWGSREASLLVLLSAYPIGAFAGFVINLLFANQYIKIRFAFDWGYWKELMREIWPLGIAGILAIIYFKVDSVMLSLMRGQADIGIYGASYKIFETLIALSALFVGVIFPIMSGYLERRESDRFSAGMQKSVDFLGLMSLPLVATCLILAPAIIRIVAGADFVGASTVDYLGAPATAATALQILSLTLLFSYQTNIYNNMIIAGGHQRALVLPNLLFLAVNVGLNWWVIPRWSYVGAAWTTVITEICVLSVNWYLLHKFAEFKISLLAMAKGLLAALAMGAVMWFLRGAMILIPLAAGFGAYVLLLMALRAVTWQTARDIVMGKRI